MIEIIHKQSGVRSGRAGLNAFARRVAAEALAHLDLLEAGLTLMFCSVEEIHRLNREFLGEDHPTDVLSFPTEEQPYLGDLAVCLPYVARAAHRADRALDREIALMIVHGILHLVGHDHDTAPRKKAMWKEQDTILARCASLALADNLDIRSME